MSPSESLSPGGVTPPVPVVTVAVLTYQRPAKLRAGLPLVLDQVLPLDGARVLVIDNDPGGSAEQVVAELGSNRVHYVLEPRPGVSAARNRALDESLGSDLLVFLDDDEQPRPDWLCPLLDTWALTRPAAVMGRVVSLFEHDLDPWVAAGEFFRRPRMPTGTEIPVAATGNLLLDLVQVRALGVRFDASFGLSGGEDSLFTRQIARAGGRMVWCDESVADDFVPAERTTRTWLRARVSSQASIETRVRLRLASGPAERARVRLLAVPHGLARIAAGGARSSAGKALGSRYHQARGMRVLWRGLGRLRASVGAVHEQHTRTPSHE